jgi:pimeloyl-ACP methyl ester carboxylesterase
VRDIRLRGTRRKTLESPRRRRALGATALTATVVAVVVLAADPSGIGTGSNRPVGHHRMAAPRLASSQLSSASSATTTTQPSPPYAVQEQTITLVDPTRDTPARGEVPAHAGRVLVTDIFRPERPAGQLPLVVFAHGWDSDPNVYLPLLNTWAAAGYLVAAPVLPDSADTLPGSPVSNYPAQAGDLSFVITQLLGGVAGPVDPNEIAVAGHSDGGTDVALMALNPAYADHRIRAYLSLSGEIPTGVAGPWGVPTPGALFVAVGTADQYGLAAASEQVFDTAQMTKAMVTVAGGDHLGTFISQSSLGTAVRAETLRFLEAALAPRQGTSTVIASELEPAVDPTITIAVAPA